MLSVYFYLVIGKNSSEDRFRRKRGYVYAGITALGLGLASCGLWFYDAQVAVCYVVQPPVSKTWLPVSILYTTPICLALPILMTSSCLISCKVFQIEKASKEWKAEKKSKSLARQVFLRSFWYVMSFVVTLPFLIVSYYTAHYLTNPFTVMVLGGIFAPIQWFLNALVYFNRARVFEQLGNVCSKRRRKKHSGQGTPEWPALAPSISRLPSSTAIDSSHGDHANSSTVDQFAAVKEFCDLTKTDGQMQSLHLISFRIHKNAATIVDDVDEDVDDHDEGVIGADDPNDDEERISHAEFVNDDQALPAATGGQPTNARRSSEGLARLSPSTRKPTDEP
jgi:hypothetical protein